MIYYEVSGEKTKGMGILKVGELYSAVCLRFPLQPLIHNEAFLFFGLLVYILLAFPQTILLGLFQPANSSLLTSFQKCGICLF